MPAVSDIHPEAGAVLTQYAGKGFLLGRMLLHSGDVALAVYKNEPGTYTVVSALKIDGIWVGSVDCFRGSTDDAFVAIFSRANR